ncbi:MAG TPA: efflux RND transporter periplasmic adaptor subunit, partial [Allocoleopsis sp.]
MQLQGKQRFTTRVYWLVWSGILTALSAGGWLVYGHTFDRSDKPIPVNLVTVERGNVEVALPESGTVELGGQQSLKSPGEVTVDRVLVKVGDRVRFGQKLLLLRNREG